MTTKPKTSKKKAKKPANNKSYSITGCEFVGVKYDETATAAITTIADGLVENAKALGILARVLNGSNANIETMLKVDGD